MPWLLCFREGVHRGAGAEDTLILAGETQGPITALLSVGQCSGCEECVVTTFLPIGQNHDLGSTSADIINTFSFLLFHMQALGIALWH